METPGFPDEALTRNPFKGFLVINDAGIGVFSSGKFISG
jgi:hypothetical protein